jgi:hypothetical protein
LSLDTLRDLNEMQGLEFGHPETQTRIAQYELAFRMQVSVPEVMDITRESADVLSAYGAKPGESSFANNCLLARRLVEQGVRYVQLFDWGWDFHGVSRRRTFETALPRNAPPWIDQWRRCSRICDSADCSMTRWSFWEVNLGARRFGKVEQPKVTSLVAIIFRTATRWWRRAAG